LKTAGICSGWRQNDHLLVEDENRDQRFLTIALAAEGYEVECRGDRRRGMGPSGRASLRAGHRRLALPDGDGMLVADGAAQLGAKPC